LKGIKTEIAGYALAIVLYHNGKLKGIKTESSLYKGSNNYITTGN